MTLEANSRLGPYEILALVGAGGMGEVYRAHDTRLNRDVAIKILPPAVADRATRRARFDRAEPPVGAAQANGRQARANQTVQVGRFPLPPHAGLRLAGGMLPPL